MLLLKISYWIAFASAAICAVMAFGLAEWGLVGPAIGGFIGGSLIAGLDQIVILLTPAAPLKEAAADYVEPEKWAKETSMAELEKRLAAARKTLAVSNQQKV